MTFSVQRSMWHGFMGRLNYTYSHALDTSSNGGILPFQATFSQVSVLDQINPNCLRCQNYSNADYDIRHNITGNYVYQMPFHSSNRLVDAAVGGWTCPEQFISTPDSRSAFWIPVISLTSGWQQWSRGVVLAQPITAVQSCTSPNVACYSRSIRANKTRR